MPAKRGPILRRSDDLPALAPSAERLAETLEQGATFATLVGRLTGQSLPPMAFPVVAGLATRALARCEPVLAFWLRMQAAQLVSVAVRFLPLRQSEGQQLLHTLAPEIAALALWPPPPAAALATSRLGADLAAMGHETLDVRISDHDF